MDAQTCCYVARSTVVTALTLATYKFIVDSTYGTDAHHIAAFDIVRRSKSLTRLWLPF